jgi:hypothetical protein
VSRGDLEEIKRRGETQGKRRDEFGEVQGEMLRDSAARYDEMQRDSPRPTTWSEQHDKSARWATQIARWARVSEDSARWAHRPGYHAEEWVLRDQVHLSRSREDREEEHRVTQELK